MWVASGTAGGALLGKYYISNLALCCEVQPQMMPGCFGPGWFLSYFLGSPILFIYVGRFRL